MSQRICIFGDSISWGAYDKFGGWVARLTRDLDIQDNDIQVYNCSISGDNTVDVLKRFDTEALARTPDIILFAIGINDSQYIHTKDNPRVSIDDFETNIQGLIDRAKKITDIIIFVGLTAVDESKTMPIPWDTTKFYDRQHISQYDGVIQKLSRQNKLFYISMDGILNIDDLDDGLHPNTEGHKKMFENVKSFLNSNNL